MKIVFFGTPDFAVPSLRALTGEGFAIEAVVTQPDRPRNRSRSTLVQQPVKTVALEEGIPVLQPENPNSPEFIETLAGYQPDIGVVVAYGHILKPQLLELPDRGMINVHASLLPELRGAAPIQRAILAGMRRTGVTIMQMDAGMDTGPILHQVDTEVAADETCGELAANLAEIGALALVETMAFMAAGKIVPVPQDDRAATYAPKLDRASARVDWNTSAERVACHIRAMDPAPGAWSTLASKTVKLFGPRVAEAPAGTPAGTVLATAPNLAVATDDGAVQILEAQPQGRKRMASAAWCCGAGPSVGDLFA